MPTARVHHVGDTLTVRVDALLVSAGDDATHALFAALDEAPVGAELWPPQLRPQTEPPAWEGSVRGVREQKDVHACRQVAAASLVAAGYNVVE